MKISTLRIALSEAALLLALIAGGRVWAQNPPPPVKGPLYNTAKQKLIEGKQVFSFTQSKFDPAG
jgi:hypothetical protein